MNLHYSFIIILRLEGKDGSQRCGSIQVFFKQLVLGILFLTKQIYCNGISDNTIDSKEYLFSKIHLEVECTQSIQKYRRFSRSLSLIWRNRKPPGTAWLVSSLRTYPQVFQMFSSGKIFNTVFLNLLVLISAQFLIKHFSWGGYFLVIDYQTSAQIITPSLNNTINTTTYSNFLCNSLQSDSV